MAFFQSKYIIILLQILIIYTYKKNLIIGAIKNYSWDKIKLFFKSLANSQIDNCDIIMFVNNLNKRTINKIKSYGVMIRKIPNKFKSMRINNYRYKLYADFLSNKLDKYQIILATDVRDVIFQKDIFKNYGKFNQFLSLALEDDNISQPINKKWMINAFGKNLYKTLENYPIICSGTILGTSDIIYNFFKIIWKEINSSYIPLPFNSRHDQTIVNYIIYHFKMFKDYIIATNNSEGPIMTIGLTLKKNNISFDSESNILNGKGEIASVIHQYDRKKSIIKILLNKYDSNNSKIIKKSKVINIFYIIIFIIAFFICIIISSIILTFFLYIKIGFLKNIKIYLKKCKILFSFLLISKSLDLKKLI